jgi:hypothetical protein
MEQRPFWEANRFSASQEILHILWNPKVHYRIYKCPPPVPIPSQFNPVYAISSSYFLKIHINIILPFMAASSQSPLSLSFPYQNPVCTSPLPQSCYIARSSHSFSFDHPNNIWWGVQIIKLHIMQFSPLSCYLFLLGPNILLSALFSNAVSLRVVTT